MSMTLVRNLYPNPLFNSRGVLHTLSGGSGAITCIDSLRQLELRSNGEQGMQASLALTGLPASTSMVFQFSFWTSYKSLRNGCLCIIGSSLSSGWSELARGGHPQADGIHDTVTIEFTTPQNANGIPRGTVPPRRRPPSRSPAPIGRTHTGGGSWAIMPKDRMELMKPGYVVVIAYTATDGLRVSLESGTPLASGTTPSGVTWQAAKINKDDGHSIYCLHDGSMTLKAMAVYEADEWPTVQQLLPPISMVQRRNDAPAVIGGERR